MTSARRRGTRRVLPVTRRRRLRNKKKREQGRRNRAQHVERIRVRQRTSPQHIRVQFYNLARGMAKEHRFQKAAGVARLAKADGFPDFIALTELFGPAGSGDVRQWLGAAMSREYVTMLWSQRSVSVDGKLAAGANSGGGIALLVHRRVRMLPRELPLFVGDEERALLDGHLRVWRFDPAPNTASPLLKPIIVTLAYIPPEGKWGAKVRPVLARALEDSDQSIAALRQSEDVFAFTLAHTNAPDGGCDVDLITHATQTMSPAQLQEFVERASRHSGNGRHRAVLSVNPGGGCLRLRRAFSAHQRLASSQYGIDLASSASRNHKAPLTGVFNHAQSDSWQKTATQFGGFCVQCRAGQSDQCAQRKKDKGSLASSCAARLRLQSCHDTVWGPSDLVLRAQTARFGGRDLIHLTTKRIIWAPGTPIDHAVTFVRFLVGRPAPLPPQQEAPLVTEQQPKRQRFPEHLLERTVFKSNIARAANNRFAVLRVDPTFQSMPSEEQSDAITDTLRASLSEARSAHRATQSHDASRSRIKQLRARCNSLFSELSKLLYRPLRTASLARRVDRAERKKLNRELTVANAELEKATRVAFSSAQNDFRRHAPKKRWDRLKFAANERGAPKPIQTHLLDHQTNANGAVVTANPVECRRRMRQDRLQLYQVPRLQPACNEKVDDAMAELHLENADVPGVSPHSAAARSAADACAPSAAADQQHGVQRDLTSAVERARARRSDARYPLRNVDATLCAERDAPFTAAELQLVCRSLGDVGPGVDGLPPAMLELIGDGAACVVICDFLNTCFQKAVLPPSWHVHRTSFLYKGKNADPFCLDNYRGISIDQLMLKVYTLMLRSRLETFMEKSGGLSIMQGGFRRMRGPPESILTLAETVRAAIRGTPGRSARSVHIAFIDVKVAYDSVLHPLLFKRCMDKGVGGRFLAALQSVYQGASSRVCVNGDLLEPVPLLRGVLQGNPLSPLLFNIYLDGVIGDLSALRGGPLRPWPLGLWLPRAGVATNAPSAQDAPEDYLPCCFFADDGALLESSQAELQRMLDCLATSLAAIGLELNVRKTKWMIVPPAWYNKAAYERDKAVALKTPLRIYGEAVELVDDFVYLGVQTWWRWDYTRAWKAAAQRARKSYFGALRGGFRNFGSLASQLEYARAKIFCHFNYVAALAGSGGCPSSAPWHECDQIFNMVLRTITGMPAGFSEEALQIEAGVWAEDVHIDMLSLRLWRKSATMPPDSAFCRAIRLSMQSTSAYVRASPRTHCDRIDQLHQQTWAQQIFAAASRFGISRAQVEASEPDLVSVQVLPINAANWVDLPVGVLVAPTDLVRLIATPMPQHAALAVVFVEGVTCWSLPLGTSRTAALTVWTEALQQATYAALRTRGNAYRDIAVQAFLTKMAREDKRLKPWAATLSGSWLQPYWHLEDARLARRILLARLDKAPTEDSLRTAPHRGHRRIERCMRACYLCDCIHPSEPSVFWPETLAHLCLLCDHVRLRKLRIAVRSELAAFAVSAATLQLTNTANVVAPDFNDDSVLFTVLQLCTGTGSDYGGGGAQPLPLPPSAAAIARRASPQFKRDSVRARSAIAWMRPLFDDWLAILREPRRPERPQQSPGHRLSVLVARHLNSLFDTRRTLLAAPQRAPSFTGRTRDPVSASLVQQPPVQAAPPAPRAAVASLAGGAPAAGSQAVANAAARAASLVPPPPNINLTQQRRGDLLSSAQHHPPASKRASSRLQLARDPAIADKGHNG